MAGKLDSSLSSLSLSWMAWLRSSDEAGIIGVLMPARCRCAALASTISRQCGYRSVFVAMIVATGQISSACRMNVISGSVNSWLVSDSISTASASGSRPSVADRCGWPCPPTPGVSMNARPPLSSGLGAATSTRSTSRPPAAGARRRSLLRSAGGISITSGVDAVAVVDDQPGRCLLAVVDDGGQHRGLVVADPRDGHVEQRVEQLTLALLELTRDHHPDLRVGDPRLGNLEPLHQVAAAVEVGDLAGVVDQLDDDLDLARVIRLRHGLPTCSLAVASLTVGVRTGGDHCGPRQACYSVVADQNASMLLLLLEATLDSKVSELSTELSVTVVTSLSVVVSVSTEESTVVSIELSVVFSLP